MGVEDVLFVCRRDKVAVFPTCLEQGEKPPPALGGLDHWVSALFPCLVVVVESLELTGPVALLRHRAQFLLYRLSEFVAFKDTRKKSGKDLSDMDTALLADSREVKRQGLMSRVDTLMALNDLTADTPLPLSRDVTRQKTKRKRLADELTQGMTEHAYREYTESRKASSFTMKKTRKFRDWMNFGGYIDFKPNDELVELFGFLARETIARVVDEALRMQADTERAMRLQRQDDMSACLEEPQNHHQHHRQHHGYRQQQQQHQHQQQQGPEDSAAAVFDKTGTTEGREIEPEPITAMHVREAWRRLQAHHLPMEAFRGGPQVASLSSQTVLCTL
eukprot:m.148689 g.148689  ORF g.148689 m.148689 type:complete len:333 (-) comp17323_c0_seq5:339-1337(-)